MCSHFIYSGLVSLNYLQLILYKSYAVLITLTRDNVNIVSDEMSVNSLPHSAFVFSLRFLKGIKN